MPPAPSRREALAVAASGLLVPALRADTPAGVVVGHPLAAKAGTDVLAAGGNAVDAAVGAALVAGVIVPHLTGFGGYGGHLIAAIDGGTKVVAIDFNSAAPAAATPDMFPIDAAGQVKDKINTFGWKAAGVPGVLAGLQLALDRFGTRKLADLLPPAVRYARDGFPVEPSLANALKALRPQLQKDAASAKLLLDGGPTLRNPDLAAMLEALAAANSVEPFYRGPIAGKVATAFRAGGGLVTEADLAAYRARKVEPLALAWRGRTIYTPPPTAGGATVLQALAILKALGWDRWAADEPRTARAKLETLRLAWGDRLKHLGDPVAGPVPTERLLSAAHVARQAELVEKALRDGKPVVAATDGRTAGGTLHLSAADTTGNAVALTFTHGGSFGAAVTVPGLGLTLGHGPSRFEPRPGHPNSPGPGKRPLHNMCPTVVLNGGRAELALGGRGGRKIPNAVFAVLAESVGRDAPLDAALKAPRLHTEGGLAVSVEASWPSSTEEWAKIGYVVKREASAYVSAVATDPTTRRWTGGSR
ncbi:MAG: gamma-glutamyltransferase [Gemmataceae bacterium]